jgi:3-oxoacyl-[acyl-carrier protein] reductase
MSMDLGLKDKPVLVLAASAGIGKAVAREFAAEGAQVMLFARSEARLRQAQQEILTATGIKPRFTVGDLTRREDIQSAVADTVRQYGGIYALVNNCGGPPAGEFGAFDDAGWQKAYELTLLSFVRSIREALPAMKKAGSGRIVNLTSSSTRQVIDGLILSNTFRLGVVGLTKTLSRELAPDNILVNVAGPGKIETDRAVELLKIRAQKAGKRPEELKRAAEAEVPLGRYGQPEELARLVVFLGSEANTYISGQVVLADGGLVRAY